MKPQTGVILDKSRAGTQSQGGGVGMLMKVPGLFDCYAVTTLPSRFSGNTVIGLFGALPPALCPPSVRGLGGTTHLSGFLPTPKLSWSDAALSGLNPDVAIMTLL
jgi:hypothetical protein